WIHGRAFCMNGTPAMIRFSTGLFILLTSIPIGYPATNARRTVGFHSRRSHSQRNR
ncbi:hypothetical protein M405DRAFT_827795, partial [Rhizopogon salebrosus TDB-379]